MKILITGGLGYTGIYLSNKLADMGHNVYIVDLDIFNRKHLLKTKCTIIQEDIRTINWDILNQLNIEVIYHLAGISNDPGNGVSKETGMAINLYATMRLYDYLSKTNVKRFVYPSTCSVYGKNNEDVVNEQTKVNPISDYAYAKSKVEEYIKNNLNPELAVTILRPATVYGYSMRQRFDLLINKILINTIFNRKFELPNLNNIRPNVYIDDLVSVYLLMLKTTSNLEVFNVAFNNKKIREIISDVEGVLDKKVFYIENKQIDSRSYSVDSKNILTKFSPKNFEHSLKETITQFRRENFSDFVNNDLFYNNRTQEKIWGNHE
jgi:nucleoside-diphosphate-sugar epimerase